MSGKFHSIDQNALYLFRPSMQERLSKENPARFIIDIVEHLNPCDLEACYGGGNKQPHNQSLLFYDYASSVFSFKLGKVSLNGSKIKATSALVMDSSICWTSCKFSSTSRSILARVILPTTALHVKTSLFSIICSYSVIVNLGFFSTILASQLSIACVSILETTCIIHHCKVFRLLELKRFLT